MSLLNSPAPRIGKYAGKTLPPAKPVPVLLKPKQKQSKKPA